MSDLWQQDAFTVNRRPLDDLVWQLLAIDGYLPPLVPSGVPIDLAYGPGVWGSGVTVSARTVTAKMDLRPSTFVERAELLDALRRRIPLLAELRTADVQGRYLTARLSDIQVVYYTGAHANPIIGVDITWTAVDGFWRDDDVLSRALTTARVNCPVGTGVSHTLITLKGAGTAVVDPVITVRSLTGEPLSVLTLAGSLTTNMGLVIDSAQSDLALYDSGTLQTGTSSGNNWLVSGDFPLLSGEDGESVTVELSSTSGTPTGLLLYQRVW